MAANVLQLPAAYSFEKVGIKGKKFDLTPLTSSTGVCQIETENGHETSIIEHKCDFIYYCLEGQGYFEINGTREDFETGNLVVVPAGATFTYKGKCRLLLITTPPFYPEQEETLP